MSKKIWVIEQGQYSDYGVVGVFSSRENAEKVLATLKSDYDKPTIAEWTLDPGIKEMKAGRSMYLVNMGVDGSVIRCARWEGFEAEFTGPYNAQGVRLFMCKVWAKDEVTAIKITNEKRIQALAQP